MRGEQAERFSKFLPLILSLHLLLAIGQFTGAHGILTWSPPDSFVLQEKSNVLTCCSDIQETIFWKRKSVGSKDAKDINDLNGLVNGFRSGRFNVAPRHSSGCYSLAINKVTLGDEGTYSCTDRAGLGHSKTWELIILEYFSCQETNRKAEYMGANDFGLPQDVISVVCIAKYRGNVPPKITCEWFSGTKLLDNYQRVAETNLTTTLIILVPAGKEFNGDQLSCNVNTDGTNIANQTQIEWKSSRIVVNLLPGTTNIPSSTHNPVENQAPSSVNDIAILLSVTTGIICFGFGIVVSFLIHYCWKTPINVGSGGVVMIGSNVETSPIQQNTIETVNANNNLETVPFLNGDDTTGSRRVLINFGDGVNKTLNDVPDRRSMRETVSVKTEEPLVKEIFTRKPSFRQSKATNSDENVCSQRSCQFGRGSIASYRDSSKRRNLHQKTIIFERQYAHHSDKKMFVVRGVDI